MAKFNWHFKISEDKEDLVVLLNDGVNTMIEINHDTFYKHMANIFIEINWFQFVAGNETLVTGLENIEKAKDLLNIDSQ